jgi:hypothetical protein
VLVLPGGISAGADSETTAGTISGIATLLDWYAHDLGYECLRELTEPRTLMGGCAQRATIATYVIVAVSYVQLR